MKNIVVMGVICILAIAGYVIGTSSGGTENGVVAETESRDGGRGDGENRNFNPDSRVQGRVMSVSDTEIVVGTFARREGGRNGGGDRGQIQEMSEQEREAFRAQRQAEREQEGEREITGEKIISITEETIFTQGRGGPGAGGARRGEGNGDQVEPEEIDRTLIEEGGTVSVMLKDGTQEAQSISLQITQ